MKKTERAIHESMNRRLSSLEASALRRSRIRQRIEREEEPLMKKKMTLGLALAMAMILTLTGAALAAGVNLFEHFGASDERISQLAYDAVLETQAPEQVESEPLGTTIGVITNAYYDGESLIVAYSIENGERIEEFIPTEAEKAAMVKLTDIGGWVAETDEEAAFMEKLAKAQEDGAAYGVKMYSVYPSDHTEAFGTIDLGPAAERESFTEDGSACFLREYETPLPEGARNKDSLDVQIRLKQIVNALWFDGQDMYMLPASHSDAGAMTATVQRTDRAE